jgi:hypothetical protein
MFYSEHDKEICQLICEEVNIMNFKRYFTIKDKVYSLNYCWKKYDNGKWIEVKDYTID